MSPAAPSKTSPAPLNEQTPSSNDEIPDIRPPITPEKVRVALGKINRVLELKEQQARALHELAHTLVAQVTQAFWLDARVKRGGGCARCGRPLGGNGGEYVLYFDGKFWHRGNCT